MSYSDAPKTTKMVIIIEIILLAYMLYVLSTSLYKSYQVDTFIATAAEENKRLEQQNALLIEDYEYYGSAAYKEKIAKQNFNLVRPGEEVIVLLPDTTHSSSVSAENSQEDKVYAYTSKYYQSLSNPQKWYLFLFDRDRFSVGY